MFKPHGILTVATIATMALMPGVSHATDHHGVDSATERMYIGYLQQTASPYNVLGTYVCSDRNLLSDGLYYWTRLELGDHLTQNWVIFGDLSAPCTGYCNDSIEIITTDGRNPPGSDCDAPAGYQWKHMKYGSGSNWYYMDLVGGDGADSLYGGGYGAEYCDTFIYGGTGNDWLDTSCSYFSGQEVRGGTGNDYLFDESPNGTGSLRGEGGDDCMQPDVANFTVCDAGEGGETNGDYCDADAGHNFYCSNCEVEVECCFC